MGKDKLAESVVERVAVDTVAHREDQVGGGAVHGVPSSNHLATWTKDIVDRASGALSLWSG